MLPFLSFSIFFSWTISEPVTKVMPYHSKTCECICHQNHQYSPHNNNSTIKTKKLTLVCEYPHNFRLRLDFSHHSTKDLYNKGSRSQWYISSGSHIPFRILQFGTVPQSALDFQDLMKNRPIFGHSPLPSWSYIFTFYLSWQLLSVGPDPKELLHHYQKWNQDGDSNLFSPQIPPWKTCLSD